MNAKILALGLMLAVVVAPSAHADDDDCRRPVDTYSPNDGDVVDADYRDETLYVGWYLFGSNLQGLESGGFSLTPTCSQIEDLIEDIIELITGL